MTFTHMIVFLHCRITTLTAAKILNSSTADSQMGDKKCNLSLINSTCLRVSECQFIPDGQGLVCAPKKRLFSNRERRANDRWQQEVKERERERGERKCARSSTVDVPTRYQILAVRACKMQ